VARLFRTLRYVVALATDRATPWYVKLLLALALIYGAFPRDIIPDFLPPLGWLDDLVLVPLIIALALRLVPPQLARLIRERLVRGTRK
jgi:uncharacterized membrane protein YkvA (DUF1232 family)